MSLPNPHMCKEEVHSLPRSFPLKPLTCHKIPHKPQHTAPCPRPSRHAALTCLPHHFHTCALLLLPPLKPLQTQCFIVSTVISHTAPTAGLPTVLRKTTLTTPKPILTICHCMAATCKQLTADWPEMVSWTLLGHKQSHSSKALPSRQACC